MRRSRSSAAEKPNWRLWVAGALLGIAIVFGGGGTPSPGAELVVELAALAAIVVWAWRAAKDRSHTFTEIDRPLLILAALFVAIPVLQLVPLPPAIWHNLPGREIEVQALALVGRDTAWMPLSESPPHTLASLLSLIPPITMLVMVSRLRERERLKLVGLLAVLGLVAAVIGVFQLASGNANWFRFYWITSHGFATGFQANRNADADVLLIAAVALMAWAMADGRFRASRQSQIVVAALFAFLVLSVVLTGSRTGVVLLVIVIVASVAMMARMAFMRSWRAIVALGLSLIVIAGAGYVLSDNARVQQTLSRFDNGDAIRPEIWKDTIYAIDRHWPAGSGVGTFQPVFAAAAAPGSGGGITAYDAVPCGRSSAACIPLHPAHNTAKPAAITTRPTATLLLPQNTRPAAPASTTAPQQTPQHPRHHRQRQTPLRIVNQRMQEEARRRRAG